MKRFDDFTGRVFGWLTVTEQARPDEHFNTMWHARCRCGSQRTIRASQLREGKFFTCGSEECRFWSKVDKDSSNKGCWLWTGAVKDTGYGVFKPTPSSSVVKAHHYAWLALNGSLGGKWLLHTCDDRRCCNPYHLYLGTHQDNMDDMARRNRAKGLSRKRLTSEEKSRMKEEYRQGGLSHPSLAKKYGVSIKTVGRILRGESRRRKRS